MMPQVACPQVQLQRHLAAVVALDGTACKPSYGSMPTLLHNCAVQFREADIAPSNSIRKRWVRASHSASKLGKVRPHGC